MSQQATGPDALLRASDALVAAADALCEIHAYRDAAQTLRTALGHWPRDAGHGNEHRRLDILNRLARCAELCAEHAEAVTLLGEVADGYGRAGDALARALTLRRLATAHELRGDWRSALAARETAALEFAKSGRPEEAAIDRLAIAAHQRSAASYSDALATLSAASDDAQLSGRADLMLRAEGLRGNVLSRLGQPDAGLVAVRSAIDEALRRELPDIAAELQQRLADSLEHSGDYPAAAAAYGTAYLYCDSHGTDAVGQLCRACATAVLFSRGEWDRAVAVCSDVLAEDSAPHPRAVSACLLGLIWALRGDAATARPHLLEASALAARIELAAIELLSAWGLAVLEDQAGAVTAASDRLRQALVRLAATQERHYCVPLLAWAATFFAGRGLADDARACAAALSAICAATAQPEAVASLAHVLGEAALPGDPAGAAGELRRAAGMFTDLGLPFSAAQAQYRAALAAAAASNPGAARELLRAARRTASELGAQPLLRGCEAALSELGATRGTAGGGHGRAARALAGLTAREMDVMVLVAAGNTSREVGSALFISPRTVEMHVQGCMLKLGCRTRAEAVRKLTELGALAG